MKWFSRRSRRHGHYADRDMITLSLLIVLLFLCLSFFVSTLQPLNYRADTQVLILQQQAINFDPYTAAKSAEKIGQNFIRIIPTTGFLNVVQGEFPGLTLTATGALERREAWQKKTDAQLFPETSVLKISVYDPDPEKAKQWASGIARVLETRGSEFHGGGELVKLTTIDDPIATTFPVQPNILWRMALGAVVGVLIAAVFLARVAPRTWKRVFPWREVIIDPVQSSALSKMEQPSYDSSLAVVQDSDESQARVEQPRAADSLKKQMPEWERLEPESVNPTLLSYLNFREALAEPAIVLDELRASQPDQDVVMTMNDVIPMKQPSR